MGNFKLISYRVYKSPLWDHNVRQIDPVHVYRQFFEISSNITLPHMPKSMTFLPFQFFFNYNSVHIFKLFRRRRKLCPAHSPLFHHLK